MLDPQNFSVDAYSDVDIILDIDPDDGINLVGSQIYWRVYEQEMGLPIEGADPVISKDNLDGGTIVVVDAELQKLKIPLVPSDTVNLLRNYYHEATVVGPDGGRVPVAKGIITVTGTENR